MHNYRLVQSPIGGTIVQLILFGLSLGAIVFLFSLMDSAGVLFYGLLIIVGLFAIAMLFMPSIHANNLVDAIPEITDREDKHEITRIFKVPHPLRWIIVLINISIFGVIYLFEVNDLTPGNSGQWFYWGSVLAPYIIASILANSTVDIELPDALVNQYSIDLNPKD